jgi:uncharacterized repeat protein (TIGR03803 family)
VQNKNFSPVVSPVRSIKSKAAFIGANCISPKKQPSGRRLNFRFDEFHSRHPWRKNMPTRTAPLNREFSHTLTALFALATFTLVLVLATGAQAQKFTDLYGFPSASDGKSPWSSLTFDGAGNLYGTTRYGGNTGCASGLGCGVAYQLSPPASGTGPWTQTVMHIFADGSDGATPYAGLVADSASNLYGAAFYGGNFTATNCQSSGCGVIFELSPAGGGAWTETVLYSFTDAQDGGYPAGTLTRDSAGNLYGTTVAGGQRGYGVVFKLSPSSSGWQETVLYSFSGGHDGSQPWAGVTLDTAGNLYGTTTEAGSVDCSCGTVFEVSPVSGGWKETTLQIFTQLNGNLPQGPVTLDSAGNVYGSTYSGGPEEECENGCGVVFELSPGANGLWSETRLHVFNQNGPYSPSGSQVFDSEGNLYGTVQNNGIYKFSLVSGVWKQTGYFSPRSANGGNTPIGGLIIDASGNLYGSFAYGGTANNGGVFKFIP